MSNIELFLDSHRISWEHNIDRQLNPPRKFEGNPILEGEHPWEASFVAVYGNVLPRDRFQALRPRKLHLDGIIETKPLDIVENSDLKLNVDATHGQVEVELVDYDGTTIEGFSRTDCTAIEDNNGLDIPVRWGDRMIAQATGMAAARPPHVRVRIYLKQASLFAADLPDENPWPIPREYGTTSDLEHMSPKA